MSRVAEKQERCHDGVGNNDDQAGTSPTSSVTLQPARIQPVTGPVTRSHQLPFNVKFAVGPMVGQSDLAFRMLTRKYGATVCYTPMLYADRYANDAEYRRRVTDFGSEYDGDRPLIVQFAANDPDLLLKAARHVEGLADAVDINLGCPQSRAADCHYGAYLLDRRDWPLVRSMVETLHTHLSIPVTCKIRLLETMKQTLEFCLMLQEAGCAMIAIHGRKRGSMHRRRFGAADINQIAAIAKHLTIPVIANGNIRCHEDAINNLASTECAGVMSAECVLANPRLFSGEGSECVRSTSSDDGDCAVMHCVDLADEYMSYCTRHRSPPLHWIADHVHNIVRSTISRYHLPHIRTALKRIGREDAEAVINESCYDIDAETIHAGMEEIRSILRQMQADIKRATQRMAHSQSPTTGAEVKMNDVNAPSDEEGGDASSSLVQLFDCEPV